MPKYGFRLYKVHLTRNNEWKTHRPFIERDGDTVKWSYATHFKELCSSHIGTQVRGFPRSPDADPPTADELSRLSAMRMESVASFPGGVMATFLVGRHDGFDKAIPPSHLDEEDDKDLEGYTIVRPFRAILSLTDDPEVGVLAVESIGNQCPIWFLTKWTKKWSQERSVTVAPGDTQPGRVYWQLRHDQMGNDEQRRAFLRNGSPVRVVLQSHEFNKARKPIRKKFEITIETKGRAKGWLQRWVAEAFEVDSDSEFAKVLAGDENDGFRGLDIDDGYLVVQTSGGRKKVSPSRLPEAFTYEVDPDERPDDDEFKTAVRAEILSQLRVDHLSLDETQY
ncbi:hypothetical protein ACWGLC_15975 [Dietzia sp. NPDC055877]